MQISFASLSTAGAGALVVGALDGGALTVSAAAADKASGGALTRAKGASRFTGKPGQVLEVLAPANMKASRILLVGLGAGAKFDGRAVERMAASLVGRLFTSGEKEMAFAIAA